MEKECLQCEHKFESHHAICDVCMTDPVCFALEQSSLVERLGQLETEKDRAQAEFDACQDLESPEAAVAYRSWIGFKAGCHAIAMNALAKAKSRAAWLYVKELNIFNEPEAEKKMAEIEYERAINDLGPWAGEPEELLEILPIESPQEAAQQESTEAKCPLCQAVVLVLAIDSGDVKPCPECLNKFVKEPANKIKVVVLESKKEFQHEIKIEKKEIKIEKKDIKIEKKETRKEALARKRKKRQESPPVPSKPAYGKWATVLVLFSTAPAGIIILNDLESSPKSHKLSVMAVVIVCQLLGIFAIHKKRAPKAPETEEATTPESKEAATP